LSFSVQLESRMERKRKALTLETKYEIINEFEKSGKSKIEIAKHYDIPKSILSGILNKKDKIIEEFHLSTSSPKRKRQRYGKQEDVDEALFQWFQAARQSNIPLNGIILQKKADDLALKLGHNDFRYVIHNIKHDLSSEFLVKNYHFLFYS